MARSLKLNSQCYLNQLFQQHLFLRHGMSPNVLGIHNSAIRFGYKISDNLNDCYQLLRLDKHADDEELKQAYMKLAKEYHPDSTSVTADARKFNQLQEAYRTIKAHRIDSEAQMTTALSDMADEDDDENPGYKRKAPQHRQYLSNEGIGFGTPSQRQRQFQQHKVSRAVDAVTNKRISIIQSQYEDALLVQDKKATKKKTIKSGMERLVEDLIQESMAKGEFENLPGAGKPLKRESESTKGVDGLTYHLNKIVIDQGFAPEWVRLTGDIGKEYTKGRENLRKARAQAGPEPVSPANNKIWETGITEFEDIMIEVNKKIDKLNLVAPSMHQQQVRFNVNKEIEKVSQWYKDQVNMGKIPKAPKTEDEAKEKRESTEEKDSLWQGIKNIFT